MSAIDELRKLLDERGVEWTSGPSETTWACNGWWHNVVFEPWSDSTLKVTIYDATPAQAIAATLGSGKLTAKQVREAIERHSAWVIGNNRCFRDGAYEAIADELNATLESDAQVV